ncbi:MAG: VWA domain-containing protein [Thermoguttaceae bacterium]|jgi:hypothetical protein
MRKRRLVFLMAMLVAGAGRPIAAFAPDESKADRTVLRTVQKQIHSQIIAERVEGVKRLRDVPAQDAVKLIVPLGLTDPAEEVRRAVYETLLTWRDDRQVDVFLLKVLEKETRANKGGTSFAAPLIAVLFASKLPDTQHDLFKFLDAYASASQEGIAAIITAADELGKQGDEQSLASLRKMTRLKCFSSVFALRRAVVQAIILIRLPEAVQALTSLLPDVDGEVRGDILRHLAAVSGQWYGADGKAWQNWWEKNKDGFKFPASDFNIPAAVAASEGTPSYYGLGIQARRMVFVVDISGSMEGPRLLAAKRELMKAIDGLSDDAAFNIVVFSDQATVWRRSLMPATPAVKKAAMNFIYVLRAGGHTAAYDALDAAFRFDAEAIYFLSDGAPNAGKIPVPAAILTAVTQTNRARRISIYTIGIAPGEPGGTLDLFMKTLAEQNFGVYRRVDQ